MTDINTELVRIQQGLKAGKDQDNDFGGYKYRSAEQVLSALKPLLADCSVVLSDEMEEVGGRVYVCATATLRLGEQCMQATAYARESESKKGMDDSQLTGSTSSYARKYALCGLFGIDDNKDADTNEFASAAEVDEQIQEIKNKARRMLDDVIAHQQVVSMHMNSVIVIKDAIREKDYTTGYEAWKELGGPVQEALWLAPTKGGIWTVEERKIITSAEFKGDV